MALASGAVAAANRGLGESNLAEAKTYAEYSLTIARDTGHQFEISNRLIVLGQIIIELGEYEAAKQYFEESLAICRAFQFTSQITMALTGLSQVSWCLGDAPSARKYLHESLEMGMKSQTYSWVLEALFFLGSQLVQTELAGEEVSCPEKAAANTAKKEQTVKLLSFVIQHPAVEHIYKDKSARLLAELEAELPPDVFAVALERGKARQLEDVVAEILAEE
jgi:tetratricopeptide (TPR) repeat protein